MQKNRASARARAFATEDSECGRQRHGEGLPESRLESQAPMREALPPSVGVVQGDDVHWCGVPPLMYSHWEEVVSGGSKRLALAYLGAAGGDLHISAGACRHNQWHALRNGRASAKGGLKEEDPVASTRDKSDQLGVQGRRPDAPLLHAINFHGPSRRGCTGVVEAESEGNQVEHALLRASADIISLRQKWWLEAWYRGGATKIRVKDRQGTRRRRQGYRASRAALTAYAAEPSARGGGAHLHHKVHGDPISCSTAQPEVVEVGAAGRFQALQARCEKPACTWLPRGQDAADGHGEKSAAHPILYFEVADCIFTIDAV
jgi:hypothetical protein